MAESKIRIFGLPLYSIGMAAKGFFALGMFAKGVIAVGQLSMGVIAIGQLTIGVISISQGSIGVISVCQFGIAMVILAQAGIGIIAAFGIGVAGFISTGFGYYHIPWGEIRGESSSFGEAVMIAADSVLRDPQPLIIWSAAWFFLLYFIYSRIRRKYFPDSNRI